MEDPKTIFQGFLDGLSAAISSGGAKAVMPFFSLPYLHEALDAKVMLENQSDLEDGLASFYATLSAHGVDQSIRLVTNADYLSPNYIEGIYVSHMLRGATPVVRSFTNRAVIRRTADGWKITHTINGFSHKVWPIKVFYVPDVPPEYGIAAQDDVRREATEPLAIYQSFINRMTQANVAGDVDAYNSLCHFPYTFHTEADDDNFATEDDARRFVEAVVELLDRHEVEDFVRIADRAEFVSASEICGYHTTHFLRGGEAALEPVKSRIILQRVGTQWLLRSVTNSLNQEAHFYRHQVPSERLVTDLAIQQRTKSWPTLQ